MVLCFAALLRVLKSCAKPKITNKLLCGALLKVINERYGDILEVVDDTVSKLNSCRDNLSPANVVNVARSLKHEIIEGRILECVMPLLLQEKIPLAILALQDIALSSISEDDSMIGRMSRRQLSSLSTVDPTVFLSDILMYTVTEVANKSGKTTISQVTPSYVETFESRRNSITIESSVVVVAEELACTLDGSDFEAVFRKIDYAKNLDLKNQCGINLYYLDISDSAFDYTALNEYLFDSVGMYVYSRAKIQDFYNRDKVRSIGARALRLMNTNGRPDQKGTGNELGEMLLFTFLEAGLRAPKLLSKVEINTSSSHFQSKCDSVHLLKRRVNGNISFQLVFGASSLSGQLSDGIDSAFNVISAIKSRKVREMEMVDDVLFNHSFDDDTTAWLRQILIPNKNRQSALDMAFGVFIGYSLDLIADDNDAFRRNAVERMKSDIADMLPYIEEKVNNLKLGMHSYYFYFLPFNDVENDKKQIMNELLL